MKKQDHVYRPPIYAGNNFYIRPTYVVSLPEYVKPGGSRPKLHRNSRKNLESNDHKGQLSQKAAQKIKNAVNWLVQASKPKRVYDAKSKRHFFFRVNFITLTIPACENIPSDHFVKSQVFHPWLMYASKFFKLKNYVWRAEVQKNGMIHFHLVTDAFIHHKRIRKSWNKLLKEKGLLTDFTARHGHDNPNSTDVHSVKGVNNLGAYISKYVSKAASDVRAITGRLWGCNYELSHECKTAANCDPDETGKQIRSLIHWESNSKMLLSKPDAMGKQFSVGEIYMLGEQLWKKLRDTPIGRAYFERIFKIRSHYQQMPIEYYTINQEQCQSTTPSTQVTGLLKSGRQYLKELATNVKNATSLIIQSVTETSGKNLCTVMNSNNSGQNETVSDFLKLC